MTPEDRDKQLRWARSSYLALAMLPHDTPEDIRVLEGAADHWARQLEHSKWPRALGWFTNYAFLDGNHYPNFRWNETTLDWDNPKIQEIPADSFIPKTSDNRCVQPVQHNVSLLTRIRPEPRIEPNSTSPFDIDAAGLGETLLSGVLWERTGIPEDLEAVAHHLCCCGTTAMETIFDETDFPIITEEMKTVTRKSEITGEPTRVDVATGRDAVTFKREIQNRVWTAFEIDPDPGATDDPKSHSWFVRSGYADIDWIRDRFDRDDEYFLPDNLKHIPEDSSVSSPLYWKERLKDLLDSPNGWYGLTTWPYNTAGGFAPNQTCFRFFDVKPTKYHPRGRTMITAGGVMIYCGPSRSWHEDYAWRWHPYSFGRYWRIPGRFWGMPLLSELVPLQRRINSIDALLQINREYIGLGQWLIPGACKVPDGATSGMAGQEIRYRITPTGQKPERIKHEPLPGDVYQERAMVERQMREIAGMQSSLEGKAPSGIRAAQMLEFLKNQMTEQNAPLLHMVERMVEGVAQNMLIEAAINYDEPDQELTNLIRVAARNSNHDLQSIDLFLGSDLRDNTHVKIDMVSSLLQSPEAKKQLAIEFMQANQNSLSQAERAIVARILEFDEFDRQVAPQYEAATRMIAMIEAGRPEALSPAEFHDAQIFSDAFQEALLRSRVKDHPAEVQDALHTGWMLYGQIAQEKAQAAAMKTIEHEYLLSLARMGQAPGAGAGAGGGNDREEHQVLQLLSGGA